MALNRSIDISFKEGLAKGLAPFLFKGKDVPSRNQWFAALAYRLSRGHSKTGLHERNASVIALGFILGLVLRANAEKQPVSLDCTAEDGDFIGLRMCTELRDQIALSPRYRQVLSSAKQAHWTLHVVSTACNDKDASAQSVTITVANADGLEIYLTSSVLMTGERRVKEQAEKIMAALDQDADQLENTTTTQ